MALRHDPAEARMLIGGAWCEAAAGSRFDVRSPASGNLVGTAPAGAPADAAAAVDAAARAFPGWARRPAVERSRILYRWWELILAHREELALLITREMGKPLAEARGEVVYAADYALWYAEEARRNYGEILPVPAAGKRLLLTYEPVGVVGAITPWNFPAGMITRKVAPALAAGCTVVLKPAELTPLTALALADLAEQAGMPPGVLNVVTGEPRPIGEVMLSDSRVRKISFTGSTAVGKSLMARAASQVKLLSLELGGHAPFLIFADGDLDAAVAGALGSKYRCTGQSCVSTNRFLVHASVATQFADRLARAAGSLRVGDGEDESTQMGPLVSERQLQKVEAQVADAVAQGASLVTGGARLQRPGSFFAPTVLMGVTPQMRIFQEETFGPVAPVIPFETEEEAIALANETPYGLAAYIYSRDLARALRVSDQLEYGMIGINETSIGAPQAPHGGIKESGVGRESGHWGMEGYLEPKYVSIGPN